VCRISTAVLSRALLAATLLLDARPTVAGQSPLDLVLDGLVEEVLVSNLEVAGAKAGVAQRLAALDVAKARYLPSLDLSVRYTRAEGGRKLEIPVGDLMNPVYSTLNDLLVAQGKPGNFPVIDNYSIAVQRQEEQQSGLLLLQPIFDLRIPAARRAAESEHLAALGGLAALRGRLARETRNGYYRWLGLRQTVEILDSTLELTRSNLAVNESLFRNGKITQDLVYRAEADVLEVEQHALAATNAVVLAKAWVNLLRNQPFDRELDTVTVSDDDVARERARVAAETASPQLEVRSLQDAATARRPELRQLDSVIAAATAGHDAARAANYPTLGLAVDAGSQGASFGFDNDDLYVVASLVLRFNLFRGGADAATIREATSRIDELKAARSLAEQRIRVEVLDTLQVFHVAQTSLKTSEKRAVAAEAGFRIAQKKRDLGQINQTEFIDSRRALTDAQLNRNRTRFEALAALAAIEYATGVPTAAPTREVAP
jgi:outer membrane protein